MGFADEGTDLAIDVSVCCSDAIKSGTFADGIAERERKKLSWYTDEVPQIPGLSFSPFVLGSRGGFGRAARRVFWVQFLKHAKERCAADWRHSLSARSFGEVWIQKLSAAMASRAAVGAMLRAPLLSRQLAYYGYGLNYPIPAEVVDGGGGADPIVVDAGPGVSVARGAGGESSAPHRVRFSPVLRG